MRMGNSIFSILEELWRWTWPVDCRNGDVSYKGGNWRLLGKIFKSKPIKRGVKPKTNNFKAL